MDRNSYTTVGVRFLAIQPAEVISCGDDPEDSMVGQDCFALWLDTDMNRPATCYTISVEDAWDLYDALRAEFEGK